MMTDISDIELIKKCIEDNDKAAWEVFAERYSKLVWNTVRKTFNKYAFQYNQEDIEDMYSSVFLSLLENDFKKLRQFKSKNACSVSTWLAIIIVRMTIDFLRKDKSHLNADSAREEIDIWDFIPDNSGRADKVMENVQQENNFKRLIAHNALNTNFGNKKIWGPDRTHQRKIDEIDKKIKTPCNRLLKLGDAIGEVKRKISDAILKGHWGFFRIRTRKLAKLEESERELKIQIANLEKQKQKLGEPSLRADRDFRKQMIMTFRSLWMENALRDFISLITISTKQPIDMEVVLELFFYRRGVMVETDSQILYWVESNNLSSGYRTVLEKIIEGFNSISLTYRGKVVLAKIAK